MIPRWSFPNLCFFDFTKIFLYLFFAFLPFQIKSLIFTGEVYGSGFFNPYLSQFLYVGDLILIMSLVFLGLAFVFDKRKIELEFGNFWIILLAGIFLCTSLFSFLVSDDKVNTLFYILRQLEFFIVFLLLSFRVVKPKTVFFVFIISVLLSSFVGIFQYIFQESVSISFLGEPVVSNETLGVAKVKLLDSAVLRAYGTFPHPNLFAGYIFFAVLFLIYKWKNLGDLSVWILSVLVVALIFTFSRSVGLALVSGLVVYAVLAQIKVKWKYVAYVVLAFVILFLVSDVFMVILNRLMIVDFNTVTERGLLYEIGGKMFVDNLLGVGVGNFTEVMQQYVDFKLMPWQYQPVHNMFILILDEAGVVGLSAFLAIFGYTFFYLLDLLKSKYEDKKLVIILIALWTGILVIGLFDHYFISLYQGQALLWLFFGLAASL